MAGLLFFWIIEGIVPIAKVQYHKLKHAGVNLFFTGTMALINLGFAFVIIKSSDWAVANNFGLLQWVELPWWGCLIIGLLIMDLIGAYLVHWIEHQVYWMWRFHVIHHSDTKVDTTTALRHHPGESIFRAVFTLLAVLVAGAPIWILMLYQSLSAFMSQFNHANLKLSSKVDKALSFIIITPGMHRIHHHFELPYTDRNYGNIFSLWDRIFGTYAFLPTNKIIYGLDVFNENENHLGQLLTLPTNKENYHRKDHL